jgi:hypothetical protein
MRNETSVPATTAIKEPGIAFIDLGLQRFQTMRMARARIPGAKADAFTFKIDWGKVRIF